MKTEYSLECVDCGLYNLQDGVIDKGNIYCIDCHDKIMEKRRVWRFNKKFKKVKVPIKFKRKDGKIVTMNATKVIERISPSHRKTTE